MTTGSFYSDTPNYATNYPTQNDTNTQPVNGNTQAPSSFYPNGTQYATLANSDTLTAEFDADLAAAQTAATSAQNSAASAAASLAAINVSGGTATPLMDGTAAVGTSTLWAHQDHVHPTDTTRAPLASPALTGVPTAPTPTAGDNSTKLATTAYADGAVSTLSGTVNTALALKAPLASPALTGTPSAPTAAALTNNTQLATTAYADAAVGVEKTRALAAEALLAPLASPALTGVPTAPTAAVNTNTTQIATTAFVENQAATATPLMNGTAAAGTGTTFSRADHVHPTDTSRAPTASPTFTGTTTINGTLILGGVGSPTALAANTNNWSPTGLGSDTFFRISASSAVNLTGITAQAAGSEITLINIGSNTITLTNLDANSTAANQFNLGGSVALGASQGITLWYDGTSSVWRPTAGSGSGGGTGSTFTQYEYTATSGQTTFSGLDINSASLSYTVGYVQVFVNGSKLNKADFTATSGTSVVLANATKVNDQVTIVAMSSFSVLNALISTNNLSDVANVLTSRQNLYAAPFDAMAFDNIIINGNMEIDQQNAGAAVTCTAAAATKLVDCWGGVAPSVGTYQGQEIAIGISGFVNGLQMKVTATAALAATDQITLYQPVEGYRWQKLGYGAAGAKDITIGFWMVATVSGTFSVVIRNYAGNRSYVTNLVYTNAGTAQYFTVTIPGDTAGTWATGTTGAALVGFNFGCGSSVQTTAGSWQAGNFLGTSSSTNFFSTLNNVVQITGVTCFAGDQGPSQAASMYCMRPYAEELLLCQRYYQINYIGLDVQGASAGVITAAGVIFNPRMRAAPTITYQTAITTANATGPTTLGSGNLTQDHVGIQISATATGRAFWYGNSVADARL